MVDYAALKRFSRECAFDPKPGDRWLETFAPICVVLEVTKHYVVLTRHTMDAGDDRYTFDVSKHEVMRKNEFTKWLHYSGDALKHEVWGECVRHESNQGFVDAYLDLASDELEIDYDQLLHEERHDCA